MKILLVEDDRNKERQIVDLVQARFPHIQITAKRSYHSGITEAMSSQPDVMLLDMSIPTFDVDSSRGEPGGRPRPYGGRDLLREVARKKLRSRVIVVTQYDVFGDGHDVMTLEQLKASFLQQFPDHYVGTIYYRASQSTWRDELVSALNSIIGDAAGKQ